MAKCDYLSRLLRKKDTDVLLLQETHVDADAPPSRYQISINRILTRIDHRQYGTMTYLRDGLQAEVGVSSLYQENIHISDVQIKNIKRLNVNKPPNSNWPDQPLHLLNHKTVITGDFNSHYISWRYTENNGAGDIIADWAAQMELRLLYNPRDKGTFHSARWRRDYTPDLVFVTKDEKGVPLSAQRKVLDNFPRSQHRPATITVGASIPVTRSLPLPRRNFRKASWELFAPEIEKTVRRIPVTQDNMMSFNKLILHSAKKFIPRGCRGRYILC